MLIMNIEILGESETFWSVLTTLVVFCMLPNDSNFIHKFLEDIKEQINHQLKSLRVNVKFEKLKQTLEYKIIKSFIEREENNTPLKSEALDLISGLNIGIISTQTDYVEVYDSKISSSLCFNEQTLSPLYSFLVCLLVFICDIILRNNFYPISLVGSFLTLFIILSCAFWIVNWCIFILNSLNFFKDNQECKLKRINNWLNKIGYFKGFFLKIFVILMVLGGVIISTSDLKIWQFLLAIIIPILLIGIIRILCCTTKGKYSPLHILGHFIALAIISIVIVTICNVLELDNIIVPLSNLACLKMLLYAFVLLFGFILPFGVPLICLNALYSQAKQENKKSQTEAEIKMNELEEKFKNFCSQNYERIR